MEEILRTPWGWALGFGLGVLLARCLVQAVAYFTRGWVREKVTTGAEGLVDTQGVVRKKVSAERGKGLRSGELWNARSVDAIEIGAVIRVVAIDGLMLEVEQA